MPIIYIDVLFLVNFVMDYITMLIVGTIFRVKPKKGRTAVSAIIGAVYACGIFFADISFLSSVTAKAAVCMLMVFTAFTPRNGKEFIKYVVAYLGATILLGGTIFMLFYVTDTGSKAGAAVKNGAVYFNISIFWLFVSAGTAYLFLRIFIKHIKAAQTRRFYDIEICAWGHIIRVNALVDTGNSLTEPITKLPVIIVEEGVFGGLELNTEMSGTYIIPYNALGTQNGVLLGFKPEYVRIIDERKYIKDVVVGTYKGVLSKKQNYRALINPTVL